MKKCTLILAAILLSHTQVTKPSAAFVCALWMEAARKDQVTRARLEKERQCKKENVAPDLVQANEQSAQYIEPFNAETRELEYREFCKSN